MAADLIADLSFGDDPRPVHDHGDVHAAIEGAEFVSAEGSVAAGGARLLIETGAGLAGGAVVAGEEDERVPGETGGANGAHHLPYGIVGGGEHGGIHAALGIERGEAFDVLARRVHGGGHGVEGQVGKE